jgi:hypothetical protein
VVCQEAIVIFSTMFLSIFHWISTQLPQVFQTAMADAFACNPGFLCAKEFM